LLAVLTQLTNIINKEDKEYLINDTHSIKISKTRRPFFVRRKRENGWSAGEDFYTADIVSGLSTGDFKILAEQMIEFIQGNLERVVLECKSNIDCVAGLANRVVVITKALPQENNSSDTNHLLDMTIHQFFTAERLTAAGVATARILGRIKNLQGRYGNSNHPQKIETVRELVVLGRQGIKAGWSNYGEKTVDAIQKVLHVSGIEFPELTQIIQ
jgi:hypothetical protein